MKFEDLRQRIAEAEVVSFDIFDTLIVRLYAKPTDLFRHLEESCKTAGFCAARIYAETTAREEVFQNQCHEVTLDEIYENLHPSYGPLQEKEIELEKLMCKANPEMLELFSWCKEQGKRIIISSDMYLPVAVIEDILKNAGYTGYEKLFLSSETKRPKATGEMYDDLLTYCGVSANQILHIGDNRYTDYEIALQKGLSAYCYEPICKSVGDNYHSSYFALLNQYAEKEVAPSILKGMITLHDAQNPTEDYWVNFGYQYAGILTLSYVQWIHAQMQKDGISQAFFMLRDGYIFKRAFNQLYPSAKTSEIYGSRSMFLLAGMEHYEDIKMHITGLHRNGLTYRMCFERLSIQDDAFLEEYKTAFPALDMIVDSEQEFQRIDEFFMSHESALKEYGAKQRKVIIAYFDSIGLLNGKNAIVDLGWKGSMLKGIEKICKLENRKADLYGYFLGTHPFQNTGIRAIGFAMNQGKPDDKYPVKALVDYGYTISVLELMFSAPHPSILGVQKDDSAFIPLYQQSCAEEDRRQKISAEMLTGVLEFITDYQSIAGRFPVFLDANDGLIPMEYIATRISDYDEKTISGVHFFPGVGNDMSSYPIVREGSTTIGIINPWPGDKSAEAEVLTRMKRAAEENNIGYIMLDNFGHVLNEDDQKATKQYVDAKNLDFVITTHYETPKILDAFHYHAVWNPPEIPLNLDYYTERVSNQYLMNDDYLIYDNGGMSNHLRGILMNKPRTLEGASSLTASFPESAMLEPKLDNPKMFYCGMNWEKVVSNSNRHEGLFKLLDKTQKVKFFGPEKVEAWGGLRPWDGYDCYQYSIPFDGFSILKEINDCGICLVLSSDIHRRAGAATNRTYEACAAGAVMISDDNEFMLRHFRDAALFINYNKENPQDTFRQIMEKYAWICSHPQEALTLANRAQEIFRETFSLDVQLRQMILNHPNRMEQIRKDLYAKDDTKKVLVTYVCNTLSLPQAERYLKKVFQSVQNQYYKNIELGIAVDRGIYGNIRDLCQRNCANATVIPMELYDSKGSKKMTDGQAIRTLQKQIEHEYYININAKETWFTDHVTTLVRTLEDEHSLGACSGVCFEDVNGYKTVEFFDLPHLDKLYQMGGNQFPSGMFLFRKNAHQFLPDFLFDCVDGYEHYIYGNMLQYRQKSPFSFSRRMTLSHVENGEDHRNIVLSADKQQRFIQDLVRFHLPEGGGPETTVTAPVTSAVAHSGNAVGFADMLQMVPIKLLVKIRYYRWKLRKLKPGTTAFQKIDGKYQAALNRYHEYWGI